MGKKYGSILDNAIEREVSGKDYQCTEEDRLILDKMFEEINANLNSDYHYIAEIDKVPMNGCGHIMSEYVTKYKSEGVRAYILPHIWGELGKSSAELLYQLYIHFKNSNEYILSPNERTPAYITARYDTAFWKLKPKKLKLELFNLICDPRDAYYLPFTSRMLASWKMPEVEALLKQYLHGSSVTVESLHYSDKLEDRFERVASIRRELKFTAIDGLKHYPSPENIELIKKYAADVDKDIKACANKTLKAYSKVMDI